MPQGIAGAAKRSGPGHKRAAGKNSQIMDGHPLYVCGEVR